MMERNQQGTHYGIVAPLPDSVRRWIEDWHLVAPSAGRRELASQLVGAGPTRVEDPRSAPKRSLVRHTQGWRLASTPA